MNITLVVVFALGVLALTVIAALVAAAETAFTRISHSRAMALAAAEAEDHLDDGEADERVDELRAFAGRPLSTLAPLALVGMACQAGTVLCGWALGREIAGRGGGIAGAALSGLLLFGAIALSRSRSLLAPDSAAVGLVPILRAVAPLSVVTAGIVRLARRSSPPVEIDPDVDEQQVLAIVGETAAIDHEEEELIKRVVAFDDTVVGDVMTPRTDLVMLRSGFAVRDALEVLTLHGLSRVPVTSSDEEHDDIIGAIHIKDLLTASMDGKSGDDIDLFLRDVPVVPTTMRVTNLLAMLQTSNMHLTIVVDEHGGVAGIASLEDILEELVGEINDEFDLPELQPTRVDEHTIRVDGRTEINQINELLSTALTGDFRTVAGCVFQVLGKVPVVGDVITMDDHGLTMSVARMQGLRIADVDVRSEHPIVLPEPPAAPAAVQWLTASTAQATTARRGDSSSAPDASEATPAADVVDARSMSSLADDGVPAVGADASNSTEAPDETPAPAVKAH